MKEKQEKQGWIERSIIAQYDHIASEYFPKVLGLDYDLVVLTDGDSLLDYGNKLGEDGQPIYEFDRFLEDTDRLTRQLFHVSISDLDDRMLIDIFKRISDFRKKKEKK